MWFIGDIHGRRDTWQWICTKMQTPKSSLEHMDLPAALESEADLSEPTGPGFMDCSLQIGDMGVFDDADALAFPQLGDQHRFFRGNHDNPELCKNLACYAGDYGTNNSGELFWMAGGFSIDREYRTPGWDWWEDEELSYTELTHVIDLYKAAKPRVMASHECPSVAKPYVLTNPKKKEFSSRTEMALQEMFEAHKPEIWIFGHHHRRREFDVEGTHFVALHEVIGGRLKDCIFEVPGLKW